MEMCAIVGSNVNHEAEESLQEGMPRRKTTSKSHRNAAAAILIDKTLASGGAASFPFLGKSSFPIDRDGGYLSEDPGDHRYLSSVG
jgi:hypothetical protein